MPIGTLPSDAKKIYEKVYQECRDKGMSEEEAAKRAWGAVRNAGYSKGEDGMWHKAELAEFSLIIRSVGLNKKTGERYWKASTSDIFPDSYNDEMSLELYRSFLSRIEDKVLAPEQYRSESWQGGMPYVSVAHYREHSIAGDTDKVYVDGSILKANGTFRDTPLGHACFNSLCDDLYVKSDHTDGRIRVSIAFLDYKHRHKATGNIFVRSAVNDVCPECVAERREGRNPGRIFLDGLLIHFAMTRVPVNGRTLMEVEKAMTTRKEDASSIVGEVLADELEEKERSLVGKSEAEVIKSEEEAEIEERSMDEEAEYRPFGGAVTLADARSYIEAGKEQRRIGDIWYAFQCCLSNIASSEDADKPKAITALANEFSGMIKDKNAEIFESLVTLSMDSEPDGSDEDKKDTATLVEVLDRLDNLDQVIAVAMQRMNEAVAQTTPTPTPTSDHPLDEQLEQLRSDFDQVSMMGVSADERLRSIQGPFDALGQRIRTLLSTPVEPVVEQSSAPAGNDVSERLLLVIQTLSDKIDKLQAAQPQQRSDVTPPTRSIPAPRSIPSASVPQQQTQKSRVPVNSSTPVLTSIINRSVGLED